MLRNIERTLSHFDVEIEFLKVLDNRAEAVFLVICDPSMNEL
jgi:hypothetical protein